MTDYSKIVPGEPPFKTHDDEIREPLEQEIERLEQQLAELKAEMKRDAEGPDWIQRAMQAEASEAALKEQLAECAEAADMGTLGQLLSECQAREMVQMGALGVWDSLMAYQYTGTRPAMTALQQAFDKGAAALSMPSDATALDTLLKQAKREAFLEAAEVEIGQQPEFEKYESNPAIWRAYLLRKAKELE